MATVERSQASEPEPQPKKKAARKLKKSTARAYDVSLPTEPSQPADDLHRYGFLIHGEKKLVKTTLGIEGVDALVLQFDRPQLAYKIKEKVVEDWKHSVLVIDEIERQVKAGEFKFDRIVIDGVGDWWNMAEAFVCKKYVIDDLKDLEWGQAFRSLKNTFLGQVNRLHRLQRTAECGLFYICHSEWREMQVRKGAPKVNKLSPMLASRCEEIVNSKVDATFAYDRHGRRRVLVLLGDEMTMAGHSIDGHFLTRDGRRVEEIDMGGSAADAAASLIEAFNNEKEHASFADAKPVRKMVRKKKKTKRPTRTS